MSKDELKELMITIVCCFPSFKPNSIADVIDEWHRHLAGVDYEDAKAELDRYIENNKGGYPPSVSNLIPKRTAHGFIERQYTSKFYEELEKIAEGGY